MSIRIKYTNEDFFYTITPRSAYWLGFIYADGYLYKGVDKRHNGKYFRQELVIKLSSKDKEHLQQFSDIFNVKIQDRAEKYNSPGRMNGDIYYKSVCRISSPYIIKPLFDMGLKNKTFDFNTNLPDLIPESYISHYIRGIFDGDGCIHLTNPKKGRIGGHIYFTMGNKNIVEHINKIICKRCDVEDGKIRSRKTIRDWELAWHKYGYVETIYNFMYQNVEDSYFLHRKYDKFQELFLRNDIISKEKI